MSDRNTHCALRRGFDGLQNVLLVVLITTVALLVFVQVVLRYVFHAPLMGIEELLLFPTTWLFMLGAVKASSEKSQIVARVLEIFLKSKRAVYGIRALAALCSCAVLGWLCKWGYDYLKYLIRMEKESPTLYIPTIWYEAMVFVALVLMILYTAIELYENLSGVFGKGAEASEEEQA